MFIKLEKDKQKTTLCSSGTNYFVIKANGNVNRCFCDTHNIGDMLDFNKIISKEATPCKINYICDTSSDQMFCTQWPTKKTNIYKNNPISINWKESNDPENIVLNHAFIVIYPTEKCNFNCAYCCNWYPDKTSKTRPIVPERTTKDWIDFLYLLNKKYGNNVQININGGEPLIRSDIDQIISKCLELNFECSMVTNFSIPKQLDKILEINNNKLILSITLHPTNSSYNFSQILKYVLLFREKGYKLRTTLLGWPDNQKHFETYKGLFGELNIPFWLKWCGGYDYSKEFKDFLIKNGAHRSTPEYLESIGWYKSNNNITKNNLDNGSATFNKLIRKKRIHCSGGTRHIAIQPNGDICRCATTPIIGNILNIETQEKIIKNKEIYSSCDIAGCINECEGFNTEQKILLDNSNVFDHVGLTIKSNNLKNKDYCVITSLLSLKCNNKCAYCSNFIGATTREIQHNDLNKESWLKIADFFISNFETGYNFILGGEPFLHDAIFDYAFKFLSNNWFVSILTNFTLNEKIKKFCEQISQSNTEKFNFNIGLQVSQQSFNETIFLQNLKILNDYKIKFTITFVQVPENIEYNNSHHILDKIKYFNPLLIYQVQDNRISYEKNT